MIQEKLRQIAIKFKEILKTKDSPHSIAIGISVGLFWNFIPSLGVGPFLSMALAKILRGNAIAALAINLATGFFIPIFYSLNIITGSIIKGAHIQNLKIEENLQGSLQESIIAIEGVVDKPSSYFSLDNIQSFTGDFIVGAVVNSFLAAGIVYLILWLILNKRSNHKGI